MKSVILYAYPPEPDGLSIQGDMLYRGLKENKEAVMPCHYEGGLQKKWVYQYFKPDVAIGIGYWGNTPNIVVEPQKNGIKAVPWLVADGWVANYQEILSGLDLALVTSQFVKDYYQRDGVDVKNFEVAPIGCEPDLYKPISKQDPKIKEIRSMLGVAEDDKMILTVGGDVTSKGAQEMFKALALIGDKFTSWKYVCKSWGSDCSRNHHREESNIIKELNLDKNKFIFLEGSYSREFMPYLLNACDIYAAPSRLEGFGLIQLEAQACGIPVISIDAMGPKETIIHNKTGFLAKVAERVDLTEEWVYPWMGFPKKMIVQFDKPKTFAYRADIEELANYTLTLLTDDKKRIEMGKAAREHAVKNFHYRDIAKRIAELIKNKLNLN